MSVANTAELKAGHRVLLFGEKLFGSYRNDIPNHENAVIETIIFPQEFSSLPRLVNYTLVILDYAAFNVGSSYPDEQDIFENQMREALDAGVTFCFVHYNEPGTDPSKFNIFNKVDERWAKAQRVAHIGFRWLDYFSIHPYYSSEHIFSGDVLRNEFKPFLDKWGASHNFFSPYAGNEFSDVICGSDEIVTGFTINSRYGCVIYLPFQRNFSNKEETVNALLSLVDCLLTYINRLSVEVPKWGLEPFFKEETSIRNVCVEIEQRLEEAYARLKIFEEAKALLFQREGVLESTVPKFITSYLGIKTERKEQYKEDFWILNDNDERVGIGEVKSVMKGFRRSLIYSIINHRATYNYEDAFPALLIANCNLQAGSWSDKDRVIDKQDYQFAYQVGVLILRIEDLVRLWELLRDAKIRSEDILNMFLTMKGWLYVTPDLEIKEMK